MPPADKDRRLALGRRVTVFGCVPPSCHRDMVFGSLAGVCCRTPLGTGEMQRFIYFILFLSSELNNSRMDVLTLSGLDRPNSFRLRGSNGEDSAPPSGRFPTHPRDSYGESRCSRMCRRNSSRAGAKKPAWAEGYLQWGAPQRGNLGRGCRAGHRGTGWICQSRSR